jgi:3-methyladenine DNA glycosylase AlkD
MSITAHSITSDLKKLGNPDQVAHCQRFFKTGPGEYGEGDKFLAIRNPNLRAYVKTVWKETPHDEVLQLLQSPFHEVRLCALLIWVKQFSKADDEGQSRIFNAYLANSDRINNWDLVDLSAYQIVGSYLIEKDREILYKLAESSLLWDRRIAIISTWIFIRNHDFTDTLELAEKLLFNTEDLMHKAVGWMLREVGKKDKQTLCDFLDEYAATMPRTTLRYAIEKFDKEERQHYMDLKQKLQK